MNWPDGAALTAFGRQALSLVAQELRAASITCLLAPDYYCPTMLVPFSMEGLNVHVVATEADCLMSADALSGALDEHPGCAVLHCETFGNQARPGLADVLDDARADGTKAIVDRTHSWLDPVTTPADFTVASLRKLAPIPDGAFVTGLRRPVHLDETEQTRTAVDARVAYLAAPDLVGFDAAEDAIDDAWAPAPPSPRSLRFIETLDAEVLRDRRLATAERLRAALITAAIPGLRIINPGGSGCIALSHPQAPAIMDALAAHGVIGPVYWARPDHLPSGRRWRSDVFTLPIDRQCAGAEEQFASWVSEAAGSGIFLGADCVDWRTRSA